MQLLYNPLADHEPQTKALLVQVLRVLQLAKYSKKLAQTFFLHSDTRVSHLEL